jgi:hypothetical protein
MHSARDDSLRLIPGYFLIGTARSGSLDRFLDVHQRYVTLLAGSDPEQCRQTQQSERAASFHPKGCVDYINGRVVVTRSQRRSKKAGV